MVIGASLAPSYASFTAFRTLKVFLNTAPQVIGLTIVMIYSSSTKRTRMINIWAFFVLIGPFWALYVVLILLKLAWRPDFGI